MRGFDGFSYADIAADIGIRKPSIHHHFPHKSDLAFALVERYSEVFRNALNRIEGEAETGGQRLMAFLEIYRTALQGGESLCLCVAFSANGESLSDPVLHAINAFHEHARTWLKSTFERGATDHTIKHVGDPEREGAAALALVEGAQLIARAARGLDPYDASVEILRARITD